MKRKYLFLDRDGTIIKEPPDEQVDTLEKMEFLPGVIRNLYKLQHILGYRLVMITNQDGLGTIEYPVTAFNQVQERLLSALEKEDILFEAIKADYSTQQHPSENRKPSIGMIREYLNECLDAERTFIIGDRDTDIEMAEKAGLSSIKMGNDTTLMAKKATRVADSWDNIYEFLRGQDSSATISRKTRETNISGNVTLNGTGKSFIDTGLGFFNHMLAQIPSHSNIDLTLRVQGDLEVDEHHTIEDTGLAFGTAIRQALGNMKGRTRYGFSLPMDESQANCLIDLGGRPNIKWEVKFQRESIGNVPTEMFEHFFKSLADASRSTIHIQATGKNEHHKIEAIFKAFARALNMAIQQDDQNINIPTSKGKL